MRFVPNHGFERHARQQIVYKAAMAAKAKLVAARVRQVAPRDTGAYARSIGTDGDRVITHDPFWHLIEYGSANNPPHAPLRRGVRSVGLRLDETGR